MTAKNHLEVGFLHPDLGIGGAERLIVDAAVGLQDRGHRVTVFTSHHDRSHCFPETLHKLRVRVFGDWLPRTIAGKFHIVCALLRNLWAALLIVLGVWTRQLPAFDVLIVDQISMAIPLLRLSGAKIVFYCHYPDLLLTTRKHWLKRLYRWPVDFLEQVTTGMAHRVLVNSKFTRNVFYKTFPLLSKVTVDVVYPGIAMADYEKAAASSASSTANLAPAASPEPILSLPKETAMFLSINRYERKKKIELAIAAFADLVRSQSGSEQRKQPRTVLVIAGGYDSLVRENIEYARELQQDAEQRGLTTSVFPEMNGQVIFLRSFSNAQRTALLDRCLCVLYTPENEHFGIVPCEAMVSQRPVIACASGGPTESIVDGQTGFLCPAEPHVWAEKMRYLLEHRAELPRWGAAGKQRVAEHFSADAMTSKFVRVLREVTQRPGRAE